MDKDKRWKESPNMAPKADDKNDAGEKSLPKKILGSAVGLLQDGVYGAKHDAAPSLSTFLKDGEKLASSSRSSSAWSRNTSPSMGLRSSSESSINQKSDLVSESFRSTRSVSSNEMLPFHAEEGTYVPSQDYLSSAPESGDILRYSADLKGKGISRDEAQDPVWQPHETSFAQMIWEQSRLAAGSVWNQENLDGAEISRLLSDPNFDPQFGMDGENLHDESFKLSAEENEAAKLFQETFSSNRESQNEERDDFRSSSLNAASSPNADLSKGFETALTASIEQQSLQGIDTFFDGLMNYHEDVWGYAQPLVEDARKEAMNSGVGRLPDGPALQRLRMIFAHVSP